MTKQDPVSKEEKKAEAGELTQWWREDQSPSPGTHIRWLTMPPYSNSRKSNFSPLHKNLYTHTHTKLQIHMYKITFVKDEESRAGKMALRVRALTTWNLNSSPRAHTVEGENQPLLVDLWHEHCDGFRVHKHTDEIFFFFLKKKATMGGRRGRERQKEEKQEKRE